MAAASRVAAGVCLSSVLAFSFASIAFGNTDADPLADVTATPAPIAAACVGDCNSDGAVTVDELLNLVNIALGNADVSSCSAGDANGDGQITIDEILTAASNALNGCAMPGPTPTPMPAPTPTPMMHMVVVGPGGQLTFSPDTLSIHVGETVMWTWSSSLHNVVGGSANCVADGRFCSSDDSNCNRAPLLNSGATYSHTFDTAGTYPYFCSLHCGLGMVGSITVEQ